MTPPKENSGKQTLKLPRKKDNSGNVHLTLQYSSSQYNNNINYAEFFAQFFPLLVYLNKGRPIVRFNIKGLKASSVKT